METQKVCQNYCYMCTITMLPFSLEAVLQLAFEIHSKQYTLELDLVRTVSRLLGLFLCAFMMRCGRRKLLIAADIMTICIALAIFFPVPEFYWYVGYGVSELLLGFANMAILLYTKEIPTFLHSALPLCLLFAFQYTGYICTFAFAVICKEVFNIELESSIILCLVVALVAILPAIIQLLMLCLVYKYEPLGYSISINFSDEAIIASRQLYKDSKAGYAEVENLIFESSKARFNDNSWIGLFKRGCSQVTLCFILVCVNYGLGHITFQTVPHFLHGKQAYLYITVSHAFYILWVLFSFKYVDRLPVWLLQVLGYTLAFAFHLGAACVFLLHFDTQLPFSLLSIMASLPDHAFLYVPTFKYVLSLLSDKGICIALSGHHIGFLLFILIDIASYQTGTAIVLIWNTAASVLGFIIAICYIRVHMLPINFGLANSRKQSST